MDTDSLFLAMTQENLDECILPSKRAEWTEKRSKDYRDNFRADFPQVSTSAGWSSDFEVNEKRND